MSHNGLRMAGFVTWSNRSGVHWWIKETAAGGKAQLSKHVGEASSCLHFKTKSFQFALSRRKGEFALETYANVALPGGGWGFGRGTINSRTFVREENTERAAVKFVRLKKVGRARKPSPVVDGRASRSAFRARSSDDGPLRTTKDDFERNSSMASAGNRQRKYCPDFPKILSR